MCVCGFEMDKGRFWETQKASLVQAPLPCAETARLAPLGVVSVSRGTWLLWYTFRMNYTNIVWFSSTLLWVAFSSQPSQLLSFLLLVAGHRLFLSPSLPRGLLWLGPTLFA